MRGDNNMKCAYCNREIKTDSHKKVCEECFKTYVINRDSDRVKTSSGKTLTVTVITKTK